MPVEVDPAERKRQVVEAAFALIVEGGLDAVTFRSLAQRLSCSTTAISHYFANKAEVLLATYRHATQRTAKRRAKSIRMGESSLLSSVAEILPISDDHWQDWVVWVSFWQMALHDPVLAEEQKVQSRRLGDSLRATLMQQGCTEDEAILQARTITTAIYGIAVQSVFDREEWSAEAQRAELQRVLSPIIRTA